MDKSFYDQVNIRIPINLNDWLNELVRRTKRIHGSKIPKEVIFECLLLHLQSLDIDWSTIKDKEDLLNILKN